MASQKSVSELLENIDRVTNSQSAAYEELMAGLRGKLKAVASAATSIRAQIASREGATPISGAEAFRFCRDLARLADDLTYVAAKAAALESALADLATIDDMKPKN